MDHLVFASPDLTAGVAHVERLLGIRTEPGGRHQGLGTHNRLFRVGPDSYAEIVAIDPSQRAPERPRWFGLDELDGLRLATWCAKSRDLEDTVHRGRDAGIDLGDVMAGSRERTEGAPLRWRFTDPWADRAGGVVPFFIDWGDTRHPALDLPEACSLLEVRVEHPRPDAVATWLRELGVEARVSRASHPRLAARLRCPNGIVELV